MKQSKQYTAEEAAAIGERIKELIESTPSAAMKKWYEHYKKQGVKFSDRVENEIVSLKSKKISQERIASILGIGRLKFRRALCGDVGKSGKLRLNEEQLILIGYLTGSHIAYITGETDVRNEISYSAYCELTAENDEAMDAYYDYQREQNEKTATLLALCGYKYENIEDTTEYTRDECLWDFQDGYIRHYAGPHKITDNITEDTIYVSDRDLEKLKERLYDTVAFECFCIKRGRDKDNGNG